MTTTATKTITLADIARAVNNLIEAQPHTKNPTKDNVCLYYDDATGKRCLIGQTLYHLTGLNMPKKFEGSTVGSLFRKEDFCSFFGIVDVDVHSALFDDLVIAQGAADNVCQWGNIAKINVDAV